MKMWLLNAFANNLLEKKQAKIWLVNCCVSSKLSNVQIVNTPANQWSSSDTM